MMGDREFLTFVWRGRKIQLRIDPLAMGALVVDARRVAYLNYTAAVMAKAFLSGGGWESAYRELRGIYRGVRKDEIRRHYEELVPRLERFIEGYEDPVTDLGFKPAFPDPSTLGAPFRVDLALTYRCNNSCIHCYSSSPEDREELSTEEWKLVIRRFHELGVPQITFTGGEPTLRGDLPDLVEEAQRLGMVTGMVTNGRLLTEELVGRLVSAGLDFAQVTLESSDPEVHDSITRVRGSWKETVEGLKNLLKHDIYVSVNATLLRRNADTVESLIRFVADLGVDGFSLNRLIYSGRGRNLLGLEPPFERMREILAEAKELTTELDLDFTWYGVTRYCELDPMEEGLGPKFCSACSITLAVEPDGSVIPCQSHYKVVGNILRDPWERIWYSDECVRIRELGFVGEACRSCPLLQVCRGGCPLEAEVRPYPPLPPEVRSAD